MDNFYDTAKRMYHSSKILHSSNEFHNACYLTGYVIECYAKVIVGLSYGFTHQEIAKEFVHDLGKLNQELNYILSHSSYAAYIVDMRTDFVNHLSGHYKWSPVKRYIINSSIWDQNNSIDFQAEVEVAMQKMAQMELDGYTLI